MPSVVDIAGLQPATFKSFVFCSIFIAIAALAAILCIMSIAHVVDLTLPGFGQYLFGQVIMFRVLI